MSELCWKIENDICRCCHGEGSFANLAVPQSIDGREEVYADMLRESLDINLVQVEGEMNNMTYTICGICIMRLRDAFMFKQQVLQCEDKFQEMYAKKFIQVSLPLKTSIKVELIDSDSADDEFILRDTDKDEDNDEIITTKIKQEKADAPEKKRLRPRKVAEKPKKAPMLKKMLTKKTQLKKKKKDEEEKKESEAEKNSVGGKLPISLNLTKEDFSRLEDGRFVCNRCDSKYRTRCGLRSHIIRIHLKLPSYMCQFCNEEFHSESPFTMHKLRVHGVDDRYKCNACDAAFQEQRYLLKHMRFYHMLGRLRCCTECGFETYNGKVFNRHMLKHKGKKYYCSFCGKSYANPKSLNYHERIHTQDRRFSCDECGKKFIQKVHVKYHIKKYHAAAITLRNIIEPQFY